MRNYGLAFKAKIPDDPAYLAIHELYRLANANGDLRSLLDRLVNNELGTEDYLRLEQIIIPVQQLGSAK